MDRPYKVLVEIDVQAKSALDAVEYTRAKLTAQGVKVKEFDVFDRDGHMVRVK